MTAGHRTCVRLTRGCSWTKFVFRTRKSASAAPKRSWRVALRKTLAEPRLRFCLLFGSGAPEEIRTPDPQIRSLDGCSDSKGNSRKPLPWRPKEYQRVAIGVANRPTVESQSGFRASPTIQGAIDNLRYEAIEEQCDLIASYARSAGEAAWRGDGRTMKGHLGQIRLTLIAALQEAKAVGTPAAGRSDEAITTGRPQ